MINRLDELVALYCRFYDEEVEEDDAQLRARDELEPAIIKTLMPETVGDVMRLPPTGWLRNAGLEYLIDKDAAAHYDQVEGFVDLVIWKDVADVITEAQYHLDGWGLCEWMNQRFPEGADGVGVATSDCVGI